MIKLIIDTGYVEQNTVLLDALKLEDGIFSGVYGAVEGPSGLEVVG